VIKLVRTLHLVIMYVYADEEDVRNLTEHLEDIATINARFNLDWKKLREIAELFDELQTIIVRK